MLFDIDKFMHKADRYRGITKRRKYYATLLENSVYISMIIDI